MSGKRQVVLRGVLFAGFLLALAPSPGLLAAEMRRCETRYYVLHTDLDLDRTRAAAIRMTKMAEEYFRRTRQFGRAQPRRKFDFYLYNDPVDYYQAGGPPGSAGAYMRRGDPNATDPRLGEAKLMSFLVDGQEASSWHTIQHEGFHQFADVSIGPLPPWINEGLAEYFGESVFTGDGYVSGIVEPTRLARIRKTLAEGGFVSVERMMDMSLDEWNRELRTENYDQAWAMVQFLAHGDNGRYQQPLARFMARVGRGENQVSAWRATFGSTDGMGNALAEFWKNYDPADADYLRAEATLRTLTSYLARASLQDKNYDGFDDFLRDLRTGGIADDVEKVGENWLPDDLRVRVLANTAAWQQAGYTFEIVRERRRLKLKMTPPAGEPRVAGFTIRNGLVRETNVE